MTTIEVAKVGLLATLQDAGRPGLLGQGITNGGAVDGFALRCANRLLGNPDNSAGLEIVLAGMDLRVHCDTLLAFCGATAPVIINGDAQLMGRPLPVPAGAQIEVRPSSAGTYTYMAVAGGINVVPTLGSRSTVIREGLGGLDGQALSTGDQLPIGSCDGTSPAAHSAFRAFVPPPVEGPREMPEPLTLRFVPGFQYDDVTESCREKLASATFTVTGAANRMAIPLEGDALDTGLSQLWSEATCLGSIQIPPNGKPIVLLNDRQTMGGYPQMGAVIPQDCARLGQSRPGVAINFRSVSVTEADQLVWLSEHYEETHLQALDTLWRRS